MNNIKSSIVDNCIYDQISKFPHCHLFEYNHCIIIY